MTNEATKTENTVAEKPATDLEAKVTVPKNKKGLVMEAKVSKKTPNGKKTVSKKNTETFSTTCVITNTSNNTICLFNGDKFGTITVRPREIMQVDKDKLRKLLTNKMVQRFFDKGVLTHNMDAADVSAHDAVAPEELKKPVERHEDGQNVKAEVKTYRKEGTVSLDLG